MAPKTLQKTTQNDPQNVENDAPVPTGASKRKTRKNTNNRHQGTAKDPRRQPNRSQENAKRKPKCAQRCPMVGETVP